MYKIFKVFIKQDASNLNKESKRRYSLSQDNNLIVWSDIYENEYLDLTELRDMYIIIFNHELVRDNIKYIVTKKGEREIVYDCRGIYVLYNLDTDKWFVINNIDCYKKEKEIEGYHFESYKQYIDILYKQWDLKINSI